MKKRSRAFIAVMLIITIGNYMRLQGNENIRVIQFVSIFIIGTFAGLLIGSFTGSKEDKNPKP